MKKGMRLQNKCLECGMEMTGRMDKKFCDHYCKSNFHYRRSRQEEASIYKKIDIQLKKNRKILKKYNRGGRSIVNEILLNELGFDPHFFTHYWNNNKGEVYLFCYEHGFRKIVENGEIKYFLIQWQSGMSPSLVRGRF